MRLLGKKPYVHDPRSLKLEKYAVALPAPPPWVNWALKATSNWGMMLNNNLGDCTCACAGHMIQSFTADVKPEVTVPDSAVLTAYEAVSGYIPGNPSSDTGAEILDVLKYWKKTGVGGHKIAAYAEVSPSNHTLLRQSIDLFGAIDVGVQLPAAAQNMGNHWNMKGYTNNGEWDRGSWGGHCVAVLAYNAGQYICVSWGELIRIDVAFWDNYMDEVWTAISPDFFKGTKSASGLNLAQMQADLMQV